MYTYKLNRRCMYMPTLKNVTGTEYIDGFCLTDCGPSEGCRPDDDCHPDNRVKKGNSK